MEPITGNAPFTVHFDDISSGEISSRTWEFGDGEISTEQDPVHIYSDPGLFDVKLTVSGQNGASSNLVPELVNVTEGTDPTAGFVIEDIDTANNKLRKTGDNIGNLENATAATVERSVTVNFKDRSSSPVGEIISRVWDFGDGTALSADTDPVHVYVGEVGDAFSVSLIVETLQGFDQITKRAFFGINALDENGIINGNVTNKSTGAFISGVTISISSGDSEITSVETTDGGLYFIQVPPGDYTLSAKKEGFKDFSVPVNVVASETKTLDIELESVSGMSLTVTPDSAGKSLRRQVAIVTAFDKDGNPVPGVNIKASASGSRANVRPSSMNTDANGQARFMFKFGFVTNNGKIIFTANGVSTMITQE